MEMETTNQENSNSCEHIINRDKKCMTFKDTKKILSFEFLFQQRPQRNLSKAKSMENASCFLAAK